MLVLLAWVACKTELPEAGMEVLGADSVQAVGDLDRDGLVDYLVMVRGDSTDEYSGNFYDVDLYLFMGGLTEDEAWDVSEGEGLDETARVYLEERRDQVAWPLGVGDLDGDYHSDVFVGACGYPEGGGACIAHTGVLWGRGDWSSRSATDLSLEIEDFDIVRPWTLGDFDDDGRADVLGGLPDAAPRYLLRKGGQRWGGSLGSEDVEHWVGDHGRMRPVGDTDGDGTGDIVTQGDDCSLIWIGGRDEVDSLDTTEAADRILEDPGWGRWTPGPAGDLDGDGIDDWWLLPEHSSEDCTSEVPEGSLVLIQGRSGGPDLLYATVWEPAGGPRIEAAVGGGDHDGDGHDDLAVLYNSDTDERGGWEILSGADVVFGADGHLTGASTWEDTYVTGAWWLDNLDLEPGHELAIGVHHPAVTTYVRVLPGGVVR